MNTAMSGYGKARRRDPSPSWTSLSARPRGALAPPGPRARLTFPEWMLCDAAGVGCRLYAFPRCARAYTARGRSRRAVSVWALSRSTAEPSPRRAGRDTRASTPGAHRLCPGLRAHRLTQRRRFDRGYPLRGSGPCRRGFHAPVPVGGEDTAARAVLPAPGGGRRSHCSSAIVVSCSALHRARPSPFTSCRSTATSVAHPERARLVATPPGDDVLMIEPGSVEVSVPLAPIILISVDTLRADVWHEVATRSDSVRAFETEAVRYPHAFSSYPSTPVSHSVMLSGLSPLALRHHPVDDTLSLVPNLREYVDTDPGLRGRGPHAERLRLRRPATRGSRSGSTSISRTTSGPRPRPRRRRAMRS